VYWDFDIFGQLHRKTCLNEHFGGLPQAEHQPGKYLAERLPTSDPADTGHPPQSSVVFPSKASADGNVLQQDANHIGSGYYRFDRR